VEETGAGVEEEVLRELVGCAQAGLGIEIAIGTAGGKAVVADEDAGAEIGVEGPFIELGEVPAEEGFETAGEGVGGGALIDVVDRNVGREGESIEEVIAKSDGFADELDVVTGGDAGDVIGIEVERPGVLAEGVGRLRGFRGLRGSELERQEEDQSAEKKSNVPKTKNHGPVFVADS